MHKIIDAHIHPFLNDAQSICIYKNGVRQNAELIKRELSRAGISSACGSVLLTDMPKDAACSFNFQHQLNMSALRLKEILGEFYVPGIHIDPRFVNESCEELEYMRTCGVNLIGELVPYMMNWGEYKLQALFEILSLAEEYCMTVSYHSSWNDNIEKIVREFPHLNIIAAHPGEQNSYEMHLDLLKRFSNYYLDLSGTGLFRYGMLKYGVDKVGSQKFLFGSDYPICNPAMNIHGILYENLSTEQFEDIFYNNAIKLLKGAV